jgi:hypothetical protein
MAEWIPEDSTIELHPAWMWDCPHCGTENFQRSVCLEFTKEAYLEAGLPEDEWDDEHHIGQSYPNYVKCRDCSKRWKTSDSCPNCSDDE